MSETTAAPAKEATFRAFSKAQGDNYAESRRDYHEVLYGALTEYHQSSGGQFDTLLDVGCGPGFAARALAPGFQHVIGIDPSEGMLKTAKSIDDPSPSAAKIQFELSSAEELGSNLSPPIPEGSVDLLVAATCAHWFDMPRFWARAAKVVKPGGTVAIWGGGGVQVRTSLPNHAAIQAAVDGLEAAVEEYMAPGNRIARDLYVDLALPSTLNPPMREFDEYVRMEWGTDVPGALPGNQFYKVGKAESFSVHALEKVMATASPIIRWREAHPEAVGTEDDVVRRVRREIERLLREAGVAEDTSIWEGGVYGTLMMVKRKL